jgi:hypothetical protein
MPSLRAAISAVLVAATEAAGELNGRRVHFPQGYLPVPDAPAGGTEGAPLELSLRLNMVPGAGPVFRSSTRFVWEVYRQILDAHAVAPTGPGESTPYAARFAEARAQFGDGLVTLSDLDYYPVDLLPANVAASPSWTPLNLGPERIVELAARLPGATTQWLSAFNLLDELGETLVASVQLETLPVTVVRSWLDEEVFTWPFWTMPGEPVSDGVDPTVGRMPHYVGDLVAVRNLVVTLGDTELPSTGGPVVYMRIPGSDVAPPLDAGSVLATLATDHPAETAEPGAAVEPSPDRPASGYLRFHVPIRFDTASALAAASARLAAASAARAQREAEAVMTVQVRDHRGDEVVERTETRPSRDPVVLQRVADAQAEEARLTPPVATLTHLGSLTVDGRPHALAVGCTVVPACPHPDPALFPVSEPAAVVP